MDKDKENNLRIDVKILSPGYTARQALLLLLHTDPSLDLQEVEEVYYPYIRFRYLIRVGSGRLMEKLNKISDCIVDRVSGSAYVADGMPEYEALEVCTEDVMEAGIPFGQMLPAGGLNRVRNQLAFIVHPEVCSDDLSLSKIFPSRPMHAWYTFDSIRS